VWPAGAGCRPPSPSNPTPPPSGAAASACGRNTTVATGRRASGGNAIFFATSPDTANYFTRDRGHVLPCYVRIEKPFDFRDPAERAKLMAFVEKNFKKLFPGALYGPSLVQREIENGVYAVFELAAVRQWMRRRGYDGFLARERTDGPLTIAVFSPEQVKSAVGNNGRFGADTANLTD